MTPRDVDLLDDALSHPPASLPAELRDLVEVAAEVRSALSAWRLTAARRAELHQRVLEVAVQRDTLRRTVWRAWRVPALLGGGLITAGAAAVIAVAMSRGRRAQQPAAV